MDPIVHLSIHDQEHRSFERAVRRGRLRPGRAAAEAHRHGDGGPHVHDGLIGGIAHLLHVRHA